MVSKKDHNLCKNAVRSAIRKAFTRSDYYKEFVDSRRIEWFKGKRKRVSYECENCRQKFPKTEINVDHKAPIGKGVYERISDAEKFYELVFCDYSNLQILCKKCHRLKSSKERKNPSFENACF